MRPLVWFRRDLRITDNTALDEACRAADRGVVGVFVIAPGEWREHDDSPVKIGFWLRCVGELSKALGERNIPLLIAHAPSPADTPGVLLNLAREHECDAIYYNYEYEVNEARRDERVAAHFKQSGLRAIAFHDHVIVPPAEVRTRSDAFFSVYTPYKKAWIKLVEEHGFRVRPAPKPQASTGIAPSPVPDSVDGFASAIVPNSFPAGEGPAAARLAHFISELVGEYKDNRDTPSLDATSRLSPYLVAGAISPRQCVAAAMKANGGRLDDGPGASPGPAHWISEIVWREFYQHFLVGYPRVCMGRAFKPVTDRIKWSWDADQFELWKQGRTGVPIVDAAMRSLQANGWMHNRLRMVVAMYLTKDLFIDWRWGEKYFMQSLIDGDLGSNNGGWQWSASTGADAAPYFRIFNPISQSQRCDPRGEFIRRWLPELAGLDDRVIHDPSTLPPLERSKLDYPEPIADHQEARKRVLAAFKALSPEKETAAPRRPS